MEERIVKITKMYRRGFLSRQELVDGIRWELESNDLDTSDEVIEMIITEYL